MTNEARVSTAARAGTTARALAELSAMKPAATPQPATTRTPSQPLMACAFRSRMSTRGTEWPDRVAPVSLFGWTDWFMVPPGGRNPNKVIANKYHFRPRRTRGPAEIAHLSPVVTRFRPGNLVG